MTTGESVLGAEKKKKGWASRKRDSANRYPETWKTWVPFLWEKPGRFAGRSAQKQLNQLRFCIQMLGFGRGEGSRKNILRQMEEGQRVMKGKKEKKQKKNSRIKK